MCQLEIDFNKPLYHFENTHENQVQFEVNVEKFTLQCRLVFEAMMRGERLTTATALLNYQIGDLRRRVKDLKDHYDVPVESQKVKKGAFKEYFISTAIRRKIKVIDE